MDSRRRKSRYRSRSRSCSYSSSRSSNSNDRSRKRSHNYKRSKSRSSRSSSYRQHTPDRDRHSSKRHPNQRFRDVPPPTHMPPSFPNNPFQAQGLFPVSYQDPNYRHDFHPYPGYESSGNYNPSHFREGIPPHFPHQFSLNMRPPNHGNVMYSGPSWEMISNNPVTRPPLMQSSFSGHGLPIPNRYHDTFQKQINIDNTQGYLQSSSTSAYPGKADDLKQQVFNKDLVQDSGSSHTSLMKVKQEAIDQELLQQKKTLLSQREDYIRQKISINHEIYMLNNEKKNISKDKSADSEEKIQDNSKHLSELQQKLKSVDNVIEMLTGIIGDKANLPEVIKLIENIDDKKSDKLQNNLSWIINEPCKQMPEKKEDESQEERDDNRVYYDPGLYWCNYCNAFPKTLSDYLDHLHSFEHKNKSIMKFEDYPWHSDETLHDNKTPKYNRGTIPKRTPIRGVQFVIPSNALFCSMCKVWLGDNHCAIEHVQSYQHSENYRVFILKNPHWEVDWLTERTKSFERNAEVKEQQKLQQPNAVSSTSLAISSLSDQLLALITAKSNVHERSPAPPPPPPIRSSSSSSSHSSECKSSEKRRSKKKRKACYQNLLKEQLQERMSDHIKYSHSPTTVKKNAQPGYENPFHSKWMSDSEDFEDKPINKKIKEEKRTIEIKRSRWDDDIDRETSIKTASYNCKSNNSHTSLLDENERRNRSRKGDNFQRDVYSRYARENIEEYSS